MRFYIISDYLCINTQGVGFSVLYFFFLYYIQQWRTNHNDLIYYQKILSVNTNNISDSYWYKKMKKNWKSRRKKFKKVSLFGSDTKTVIYEKCLSTFYHNTYYLMGFILPLGLPSGTSGKEPACQCKNCNKCGFNPWVRKIPRRRSWQLTPVFLPEESHIERSLDGYSP